MKVDIGFDPDLPFKNDACKATVLFADLPHDIAIIKVSPFPPLKELASGCGQLGSAQLGSAQELRAGDLVLSVGRLRSWYGDPLCQLRAVDGHCISGDGGAYGKPLSTTFLVDKGDDGGPLFNCKGEVVGIIAENESGRHAISIEGLQDVLEILKKDGNTSDAPNDVGARV